MYMCEPYMRFEGYSFIADGGDALKRVIGGNALKRVIMYVCMYVSVWHQNLGIHAAGWQQNLGIHAAGWQQNLCIHAAG